MTSPKISALPPVIKYPLSRPDEKLWEVKEKIWLNLSATEQGTSPVLAKDLMHDASSYWGNKAHKLKIAEFFASPLYSDGLKRYFAADHIYVDMILLLGDEFLTEEIIISQISMPGWQFTQLSYVEALMKSSHLSENIIEAALQEASIVARERILKLTPAVMVTPRVIKSWMWIRQWPGSQNGELEAAYKLAVLRIKQTHPEYEEFPDEWVFKVFCGE